MTDHCCSGAPAGLSRRHLLVGGAAAGTFLAFGALPGAAQAGTAQSDLAHPEEADSRDFGFLPPRPADEVHRRPIVFPVLERDRISWTDTYLYPRSGGRLHEGQDLIGAKMLKLVATTTGTIVELRYGSEGNSLYLKGDDGWYYCYLHINNDDPGTDNGANQFRYAFAPGMAEGVRVQRGQHIAYVGDSGNAEGTASHVHFEIRMPNTNWYNAAAVNPKYSLDSAASVVPPETFTPWTSSFPLIARQYQDLLGHNPSAADVRYWGGLLDAGTRTPQSMTSYFLESDECDSKSHAIARLYLACFGRGADQAGYTYWVGRRRTGTPLSSIADAFERSREFSNRYGAVTNGQFVDLVYRNVLDRAPDAQGRSFWTGELDRGRSRGSVMAHFSNSQENRDNTRHPIHVVVAYASMLKRMPTLADIGPWQEHFKNGGSTADLVQLIRVSSEYRRVVGR